MPDPAPRRDGVEPTTPSRESIGRLRAKYEAADEFARQVGEFRSAVAIPAHNQLRYAGDHLLRALADDGSISNTAEFGKAVAHCERAQYEAAEAGISYALDIIAKFKNDYRTIPIRSVVPDYLEILKTARDAQDLLTQTRSTDRPDDNGELPDPLAYMEMFKKLYGICGTLDVSREELNKNIRGEVKSKQRFFIGLGISIAIPLILLFLR